MTRAGFDPDRDEAHFDERYLIGGMHWEDACLTIDLYEGEVKAGQPSIFFDRLILGDACLSLLADADGLNVKVWRRFVEDIVGPTRAVNLMAILPKVIEFRAWAVNRIQEKEREAEAAAVRQIRPQPASSSENFDLF